MSAINVKWLSPFCPSTSVRYFRLRYLAIPCSVICRTPICRTCLGRRPLEDYIQKLVSLQPLCKSVFLSARKPFRSDSNDSMINNQWFRVTCIILHNLQNTNLQTLLKNSVLCNFQIKACLNQHSKPRKLI